MDLSTPDPSLIPTKPRLTKLHPSYNDTLQLTWLGTASYHIQLGDTVILTDPFYSHNSLLRVWLGELKTDQRLVQEILPPLREPRPRAVFIGHSHYDHLMDTSLAFRTNDWRDVGVYGSKTAGILLDTYQNRDAWSFRKVDPTDGWVTVDGKFQYMAMRAQHAPQIDAINIYQGRLNDPIDQMPRRAKEFLGGDTYTYLFKMNNGARSFTIFFTSAATGFPKGLPSNFTGPVDVAILCVPSWKKAAGYPGEFLKILQPRFIILSHFNDFFTDYRSRRVLRISDLEGFIKAVHQAAIYDRLEGILLPDLNATMHFIH